MTDAELDERINDIVTMGARRAREAIKELIIDAEREMHRQGYLRAINDYSGWYMDASITAQRRLIFPEIAADLRDSYDKRYVFVRVPSDMKF